MNTVHIETQRVQTWLREDATLGMPRGKMVTTKLPSPMRRARRIGPELVKLWVRLEVVTPIIGGACHGMRRTEQTTMLEDADR